MDEFSFCDEYFENQLCKKRVHAKTCEDCDFLNHDSLWFFNIDSSSEVQQNFMCLKYKADYLYSIGNYESARIAYKNVLDLHVPELIAHCCLIDMINCLIRLNKYLEAEKFISDLMPSCNNRDQLIEVLTLMRNLYIQSNKIPSKIITLKKLLLLVEEVTDNWVFLANSYYDIASKLAGDNKKSTNFDDTIYHKIDNNLKLTEDNIISICDKSDIASKLAKDNNESTNVVDTIRESSLSQTNKFVHQDSMKSNEFPERAELELDKHLFPSFFNLDLKINDNNYENDSTEGAENRLNCDCVDKPSNDNERIIVPDSDLEYNRYEIKSWICYTISLSLLKKNSKIYSSFTNENNNKQIKMINEKLQNFVKYFKFQDLLLEDVYKNKNPKKEIEQMHTIIFSSSDEEIENLFDPKYFSILKEIL